MKSDIVNIVGDIVTFVSDIVKIVGDIAISVAASSLSLPRAFNVDGKINMYVGFARFRNSEQWLVAVSIWG